MGCFASLRTRRRRSSTRRVSSGPSSYAESLAILRTVKKIKTIRRVSRTSLTTSCAGRSRRSLRRSVQPIRSTSRCITSRSRSETKIYPSSSARRWMSGPKKTLQGWSARPSRRLRPTSPPTSTKSSSSSSQVSSPRRITPRERKRSKLAACAKQA